MDLLEGGSANVLEEMKKCGSWSEIVAIILPEIMSFEITLLKIFSIRVREWLVHRLG